MGGGGGVWTLHVVMFPISELQEDQQGSMVKKIM